MDFGMQRLLKASKHNLSGRCLKRAEGSPRQRRRNKMTEQESPMYLDNKGQWQIRDRPELREKIASIVLAYDQKVKQFLASLYCGDGDEKHPSISEAINELLALIPDIEEYQAAISALESNCIAITKAAKANMDIEIEEAKREGKEKFIKFVEWLREEEAVSPEDWDSYCEEKWQALKGE